MSTLNYFLLRDALRGKIRTEGAPGSKTPALLNTKYDEALEDFLVSTTSGELTLVQNSKEGVCSAFFPLELEDEDAYLGLALDRIFQLSCKEGWGNVVLLDEITAKDLADYLEFFSHYDLEFAQVLTGKAGYEALIEHGILNHPGGHGPLSEMPDPEELESWAGEYFMEGQVQYRPVKYNKFLGPYIAFCASASLVGTYTRIGSHVSLTLHNADRGLILVRLNDYEGDTDDGIESGEDEKAGD